MFAKHSLTDVKLFPQIETYKHLQLECNKALSIKWTLKKVLKLVTYNKLIIKF